MALSNSFYHVCKKIQGRFMVASNVENAHWMQVFLPAYIAKKYTLKSFAQIGFEAHKLFPLAYSVAKNGGSGYVIQKLENEQDRFNSHIEFIEKNNLTLDFVETKPNQTRNFFKGNGPELELVCINAALAEDLSACYSSYEDWLQEKAFVVFYGANKEKAEKLFKNAKCRYYCVFEQEDFAVFYKTDFSVEQGLEAEKMQIRIKGVLNRVEIFEERENKRPTVAVGVLCHNQQEDVEKTLQSIFAQEGEFDTHIIIFDDCSTDDTVKVVKNYLDKTKKDTVKADVYVNEKNIGPLANFGRLLMKIKEAGCDFFTFCEGNHYYATNDRIKEHVRVCSGSPEVSLSYNLMEFYFPNEERFVKYEPAGPLSLTTEGLVDSNYPGALCAVFAQGDVLQWVDEKLLDMPMGDWMFTIFCSQFGDIYRLNQYTSVCQKHKNAIQSEAGAAKEQMDLYQYINQYNRYLNFLYDKEFSKHQIKLTQAINSEKSGAQTAFFDDVCVLNSVFPHTVSGFTYQELTSLLKEFSNITICATGEDIHLLGKDSIEELLVTYKRKYPQYAEKVIHTPLKWHSIDTSLIKKPKILYGIFLAWAYYYLLEISEKLQVPFVFTLYPGGRLKLGTNDGDEMLRKVFSSPWFYKVIVTQDNVYRYLIDNQFCTEEQVELIFGVVTPLENLHVDLTNKKHYAIDKKTLDICFVGHKYTKNGEDKGYDIFIEVAKKLSAKHSHVRFHVVGPWDEAVIPVDGIHNIEFYGTQNQSFFDTFYLDKDIILCPNINGKLGEGYFDGFPVSCATDAALREVAIVATDPLGLNNNRYVDGEEIVIIEHSAEDTFQKIEHYIQNPNELAKLATAGRKKVQLLYSEEAQIKPRIKILKDAVEAASEPKKDALKATEEKQEKESIMPSQAVSFEQCTKISQKIKCDMGGKGLAGKAFLMAYLAQREQLKTFVEIGVYKGESLFAVAAAVKAMGGRAYGIDAFSNSHGNDGGQADETTPNFRESVDFDEIYNEYLAYKSECGFGESIELIRKTPDDAFCYFEENNIKPHMLHISGKGDVKTTQNEYEKYTSLMEEGSYLVLDAIDCPGVNVVFEQAKQANACVFEADTFAILQIGKKSLARKHEAEKMQKQLSGIYDRAKIVDEKMSFNKIAMEGESTLPLVAVGILTYNHEKYIAQCLQAVLEQEGDFKMHIVICDDASKDGTVGVVENIVKHHPKSPNWDYTFVKNEENIGIMANLKQMMNLIKETGCDYYTFCEGDDYYAVSSRIQSHLNSIQNNPQYSMSFNNLNMLFEEENRYEVKNTQSFNPHVTTESLARENHIGSFCATFFPADTLKYIEDRLFDEMFTVDWMFGLVCSQYGEIKYLDELLTIYRKHAEGVWSGEEDNKIYYTIREQIKNYNRYLQFNYDKEFGQYQEVVNEFINRHDVHEKDVLDLAIIDNAFLNKNHAPNYEEVKGLLEAFSNSVAYAAGDENSKAQYEEISHKVIEYKRQHKNLDENIFLYNEDPEKIRKPKVLCSYSLHLTHRYVLSMANALQVPFIFSLNTQNGFAANCEEKDRLLKEILSSPQFYKVVVEEEAVKNYVIENHFCTEDVIEYLPQDNGENTLDKKIAVISSLLQNTSVLQQFKKTEIRRKKITKESLKRVYREWTPLLFRRLVGLSVVLARLMYRELVPSAVKRIYRKIRYKTEG